MCTNAPVVGLSTPSTERKTARKLMHIERVMLRVMVATVALESHTYHHIFVSETEKEVSFGKVRNGKQEKSDYFLGMQTVNL